MGGLDKGLQTFKGQPLVQHSLQRLQQQSQTLQGVLINANRHLPTYAALGWPVLSDAVDGHIGPLAGFLTGLLHCPTPWLLTVPCDTPLFPLDLAERLHQALVAQGASLAMAAALDTQGQPRQQPVFCLMHVRLRESLFNFIQGGGRKVGAWAAGHGCAHVVFDLPHDHPEAFANVNTPEELRQLESI